MTFKGLVQSFVPDLPVAKNEWEHRKYPLFISVCLVSALYALLFLPTSILEEYYQASYVIVFFFTMNMSFPFLIKKGYSLKILYNCYILTLALSLSCIMYISGGVYHTATDPQLMVLAPVMALLFGNFRSAILWFIIAVTIVATFGILQLYGVNFDIRMNYKYIQVQHLMAVVGHIILVFMVINIFEKQKNSALKSLEEKNILIEAEKKRSDDLLLNILPSEVVNELKVTGISKAKTFSMVTVMFTDFKDFTDVSQKVSGELLVDEINHCFSAFDNIIQNYKIEKIKTVGDAYICVGGMPELNFTHSSDIISAAIEIRDFMLNRKIEKESRGELPFQIRIGIHTGPVVAGIVGIKKFAYDIWGDTVNIASRMESSGEEGKVNISGATYELVKNKFNCTYRGKIPAKHKGEIDMYFAEKGL